MIRLLARGARRLAGRVEALRYRAFADERPHREHALGLELWVPGSVLGVAYFRVGAVLAEVVARESRPGDRLLDMGAGTGIVSLAAARRGAWATAIDVNPAAVRATRVNAMLNRLPVDARGGDLFAPLAPPERFEAVAFNPPFFERPMDPAHPLALALSDGPGLPLLARFLEGVRAHLAPGGRIYVAGSTNGALARMRSTYDDRGFGWQTVGRRERMSERVVVDRLFDRRHARVASRP